MALKGSCPVLLLPLILLGAWLALASGQLLNEKNDKFLLQHWNYPRSEDSNGTYCDTMTQCREMYGQEANTFIHAPMGSINSIRSLGGTPGKPNKCHRVAPFDDTICVFNSTSRAYTGTRYVCRIVLDCWKGLPVDYVRHI
ncbi:ribonuclease-like [Dermochelys coriacea]|uniref:ribonuclease-like n=1 Tax=Dermochelys coriacea TaxID=27794 RepID=UPI0018E70DC2|nr:ribonuclease-like [Dermochelys coriacea]